MVKKKQSNRATVRTKMRLTPVRVDFFLLRTENKNYSWSKGANLQE